GCTVSAKPVFERANLFRPLYSPLSLRCSQIRGRQGKEIMFSRAVVGRTGLTSRFLPLRQPFPSTKVFVGRDSLRPWVYGACRGMAASTSGARGAVAGAAASADVHPPSAFAAEAMSTAMTGVPDAAPFPAAFPSD
ncbi:unnamed protein product, partial [Phaeothamnion confervicola]